MRYIAACNFDAGKGLIQKGQPYSGDDAESLRQKGLVLGLEEPALTIPSDQPVVLPEAESETPLEKPKAKEKRKKG